MILKTKNDLWQVSLDNRISGLDVQVSFWNGNDFEDRYKMFVIADSWNEAITDALVQSGWSWESADRHRRSVPRGMPSILHILWFAFEMPF